MKSFGKLIILSLAALALTVMPGEARSHRHGGHVAHAQKMRMHHHHRVVAARHRTVRVRVVGQGASGDLRALWRDPAVIGSLGLAENTWDFSSASVPGFGPIQPSDYPAPERVAAKASTEI